VRVEIPGDGERLLIEAPEEAAAWRQSVRTSMQWGLSAGYTVTAFFVDEQTARGFYLMTKPARAPVANGRG
jgi:predicted GNAT superfamily acetyltransferase